MNPIEYKKELSKMSDYELEREEDEIYKDCFFYNDCSKCPHCFDTSEPLGWILPTCKLDTITDYKREVKHV